MSPQKRARSLDASKGSTESTESTGSPASTVSTEQSNKPQTSNPMDASSESTTSYDGYNGYSALNEKHRSVLCHPFGLPLFAAFHNQVLPREFLARKGTEDLHTSTKGDDILETSYEQNMTEKRLTELLRQKIDENFSETFSLEQEHLIQSSRKDCLLLRSKADEKNESTPVAVLELGRGSGKWGEKLDRGVTNLNLMLHEPEEQNTRFQEPLLLVVVTLDDSATESDLVFRVGVFLCSRKKTEHDQDDFRMALLWQNQNTDKKSASKSFGLILRISALFQTWRKSKYQNDDYNDYKYFSSHCCRVGNSVCDRPSACSSKKIALMLTTNSLTMYFN